MLNKDHIPPYARWIADCSFVNYGFEALVTNEFKLNPRPVHADERVELDERRT